MVVDTSYYDALQVLPNASELDIKKAYRKLAVKLHPDKNPGDEEANIRFQTIGEAYQVLSEPQLRAAYDKYGKDRAVPDSGFEDPAEFFSMIFGGEVFLDWIGEISLMKDLTHTMDISMREEAEEEAQGAKKDKSAAQPSSASSTASPNTSATAADTSTTSRTTDTSPPVYESASGYMAPPEKEMRRTSLDPTSAATSKPSSGRSTPSNPYSQDRPKGVQTRLALMDRSEEDAQMSAAGVTEGEKELRAKEKKKGGLTKEQREELRAYEIERQRVRDERVNNLAKKLIDRISVWTETDKGRDVTAAFREKTRLEVENLKMESFGLEILHAIGAVYVSKATAVLKSQKMFGIGGFWSRLKDKGAIAKETWGTISTAIDAQMSMEAMAKAEELGGDEWTDERRAEHEKRVTGKILAAAWRGSKMEIQSVLRDVCDKVLGDRSVRMEKRVERAQALVLMGELLRDAKRDPDEEGEYLVFETLMAEATAKKEKEKDKKKATKGGGKEDAEKEKEKAKEGGKGLFGFGGTHEKEKATA